MPFVASEACCRKTVLELVDVEVTAEVCFWSAGIDFVGVFGVESVFASRLTAGGTVGIWQMSIGTLSLWQAKMLFMMGMYWWARSVLGLTVSRKMRDCSFEMSFLTSVVGFVALASSAPAPPVASACAMVSRLI